MSTTLRFGAPLLPAGGFHFGDRGGGVLVESLPTGGVDGPGILKRWTTSADNGSEVRLRITSVPVGLTAMFYEDGGVVASAPDGEYVSYGQLEQNYVTIGSPQPIEIQFGDGSAAVVGVNITEQKETFAATVNVAGNTSAVVNLTEQKETFAASLTVATTGAINITEQKETFAMSVTVAQTATIEPITLAEAKLNLRVVGNDEDADIERMIRAARQMAEGRTRRALVPRDEVLAMSGFPCAVRLSWPPLIAVVGIEYTDPDGAEQTMPPSAYRVNAYNEPARITLAAGASWPAHAAEDAAIRVRYRCGYADAASVPETIRQWMLLAINAFYEHRSAVNEGQTYALPDEFYKWLLQPHVVYE